MSGPRTLRVRRGIHASVGRGHRRSWNYPIFDARLSASLGGDVKSRWRKLKGSCICAGKGVRSAPLPAEVLRTSSSASWPRRRWCAGHGGRESGFLRSICWKAWQSVECTVQRGIIHHGSYDSAASHPCITTAINWVDVVQTRRGESAFSVSAICGESPDVVHR